MDTRRTEEIRKLVKGVFGAGPPSFVRDVRKALLECLSEIGEVTDDYMQVVRKFDECRGCLASVYGKLFNEVATPPDDYDGAWHEWLIAGLSKIEHQDAKNVNRPRIRLHYADLEAAGEDVLRRECPFCRDGVLPLQRDSDGRLSSLDLCIGCGQSVQYMDIDELRS